MPRLKPNAVPSYRRHKSTGQAVVTLNQRDHYLGKFGSAASRKSYDRLIAEWVSNGRRPLEPEHDISVIEIADAFMEHARAYYRHPDGRNTKEVSSFESALGITRKLSGPLMKLYGETPAVDFGPLALKVVRDQMIKLGWLRASINKQVRRIIAVFKWAASQQLIPASVPLALSTLAGLRVGRSDAKEGEPVRPVPDAAVEATLPFLPEVVAAMVKLQRLTFARPGEICIMRTGDIDRTGPLWLYKPRHHKNAYRGHEREIAIGPRGQEILSPFLRMNPDEFIFSPRDADRRRREKLSEKRKTPEGVGNGVGTNRKAEPRWKPGDRYDAVSYNSAIQRACASAFPPPERLARRRVRARGRKKKALRWETAREWRKRLGETKWAELIAWTQKHAWSANQLRHTGATAVRVKYNSLEAAGAALGHSDLNTTMIYAERNRELARRIAAEVG